MHGVRAGLAICLLAVLCGCEGDSDKNTTDKFILICPDDNTNSIDCIRVQNPDFEPPEVYGNQNYYNPTYASNPGESPATPTPLELDPSTGK